MASVQILLKRALTHIPQYGFTRHALALSNVNTNPLSASSQPSAPLSDAAVTALFGNGNEAPKTLIRAWLAEGRANMIRNENALKVASSPERESQPSILTMEEVLLRRLEWNEPVLHHLKDAFALLAVPSVPFLPILNIRTAVEHALDIANDACYAVSPAPNGPTNWYVRRMGIAGIYTAAELHQLATQETNPDFLRTLLSSSLKTSETAGEVEAFANFGRKGWQGIMKGRGVPL